LFGSKLDILTNLSKWALNVPLIILCIDEFKKSLRSLRMDKKVKKSVIAKINFALGVVFAMFYIPNLYVKGADSYVFLVASWLCLFSVSNKINRNLEKCIELSNNEDIDWKF